MREPVKAKRAIAASAIVCALVLSVPCIDALARSAGVQDALSGSTSEGIDAESLTSGRDAHAIIDRIERLVAGGQLDELPPVFVDEVGCPRGARNMQVSATGKVVGCLVEGEENAVAGELEAQLAEKGWTAVPLGSVSGATFVKQSGACTWMLVTCTQIDDVTSVVFRGDFQ